MTTLTEISPDLLRATLGYFSEASIAWEEAMVVARRRHAEAHRAKVLQDQVANWEMACRIRAYVAAVDDRFPEDRDAAEWSAWALDYAAGLDPLSSSVRLPPAPDDPRPEELRPFLGRWSPYGPDAR